MCGEGGMLGCGGWLLMIVTNECLLICMDVTRGPMWKDTNRKRLVLMTTVKMIKSTEMKATASVCGAK